MPKTVHKLDKIIESLNDEQKKCVENIDGKFLVLAGPRSEERR